VLHQNTVGSRFSDIILSLVLLSSLISFICDFIRDFCKFGHKNMVELYLNRLHQ
ncbi:unnamed protein product, partial [Tenebrio molitor]